MCICSKIMHMYFKQTKSSPSMHRVPWKFRGLPWRPSMEFSKYRCRKLRPHFRWPFQESPCMASCKSSVRSIPLGILSLYVLLLVPMCLATLLLRQKLFHWGCSCLQFYDSPEGADQAVSDTWQNAIWWCDGIRVLRNSATPESLDHHFDSRICIMDFLGGTTTPFWECHL